ncbi:hypothetical protein ACJRO7_033799 [Eucalyptus globulus]|uniref:TIR domain-containing protein n=1 Tax=Eucalyptus globulus TaxID=34317 RepID=A0ABD3J4S6_EUCGL
MKRKRDSSSAGGDVSETLGAEFEVFLSFRGPDTGLTFTDCLYHSMVRAWIRVFRDAEEIRIGEEIGGELLRAINSSKIYMPIFSRNYASSAWCLRELAYMLECWRNRTSEKMIIPIFYDVDPDDVKLKTGLYFEALERHGDKFGCDQVQRWKEALIEVARIKGWHLRDQGHGKIINLIIDEVLTKLMKGKRNLPDHIVGFHDHVEAIINILDEGSRDIVCLVIHGMGGIGKTTLAGIVFNQISNQFHGCSFLSNIREFADGGKIVELQKKLLSEILHLKSIEVYDFRMGINMIKERFREKKVLVVLDDVDKHDQLMKLAGNCDWFGPGSRIIITTRDINFLPIEEEENQENDVFYIYEMRELDPCHALQLFSKHAFKRDSPPADYIDVSHEIVTKAGGLPLALEVIGSSLCYKRKPIWKETLKKLDIVPKQEVLNKLKISYDMLEDDQREIFLDIACYFIGEEAIYPYYMWKASEYYPKCAILVLTRMSLIKIVDDDRLWMHNQLRDLGREIVRQEDVKMPENRSRLWLPKNALDVVQNRKGTNNVVALKLTPVFEEHSFTSEGFSKLPNLRLLELEGVGFVGDFRNIFSKVAWLSWRFCPPEFRPTNLCFNNLAVLKLSNSDISEDWAGWGPCLANKNLKVIHLTKCTALRRIPDFSNCLNLKILVIKDCTHLLVVDSSISKLELLKYLEVSGYSPWIPEVCEEKDLDLFAVSSVLGGLKSLSTLKIERMHVRELHRSIGELVGLKCLSLVGCRMLRKLPNSIGNLRSLLELDLDDTGIIELPDSIGDLKMLKKMSLAMTRLEELPNSIGGLESLLELVLDQTHILELPASIEKLKRLELLHLSWSQIRELSRGIWMLVNLEELDARGCQNLEGEIPSEIRELSFLRMLDLSWTKVRRLPTAMKQLSCLHQLFLQGCDELEWLPELPPSLTTLEFSSESSRTIPDLSNLINLVRLDIFRGTYQSSEFTKGNPKIEWIQSLSKLEALKLSYADLMFPTTAINLALLSRLQLLCICCANPQALTRLPSNLGELWLGDVKSPIGRSLFSNLRNLYKLTLSRCCLREIQFDGIFQQPENLRRLIVVHCNSLVSLSSLSTLKGLSRLYVEYCPQLIKIEGVGELESLEFLLIRKCDSMEQLPDLLKLQKLTRLIISDCDSLQSLPDLPPPNECDVTVEGCQRLNDFFGPYDLYRQRANT